MSFCSRRLCLLWFLLYCAMISSGRRSDNRLRHRMQTTISPTEQSVFGIPVLRALRNCDVPSVLSLLSGGEKPCHDGMPNPLQLCLACTTSAAISLLRALLKSGARVADCGVAHEDIALTSVAQRYPWNVTESLLVAGASLTALDYSGNNILHLACTASAASCSAALTFLQKDNNPESTSCLLKQSNAAGLTPSGLACSAVTAHGTIVKTIGVLLRYGAEANPETSFMFDKNRTEKASCLEAAVYHKDSPLFYLLLEQPSLSQHFFVRLYDIVHRTDLPNPTGIMRMLYMLTVDSSLNDNHFQITDMSHYMERELIKRVQRTTVESKRNGAKQEAGLNRQQDQEVARRTLLAVIVFLTDEELESRLSRVLDWIVEIDSPAGIVSSLLLCLQSLSDVEDGLVLSLSNLYNGAEYDVNLPKIFILNVLLWHSLYSITDVLPNHLSHRLARTDTFSMLFDEFIRQANQPSQYDDLTRRLYSFTNAFRLPTNLQCGLKRVIQLRRLSSSSTVSADDIVFEANSNACE
eukprot:GILK01007947.1.p1 GENE.GILK01007947.1~~GILK01007947.1.p1  ORF type:complete len:534 (+),score=69.61 GILK01007947.1:36-1604(+)